MKTKPTFVVHKGYIYLFFATVLTSMLVFHPSDGIFMKVVGFVVFVIVALSLAKGDIAHPYVWFLPIFSLYSLSAPILMALEVLPYKETYPIALAYHYAAMVVFALSVGPGRHEIRLQHVPFARKSVGLKLALIMAVSVSILYLAFILHSGIESKYDRALMSNPMAFLGFSFYMLTTVASIILVRTRHFSQGITSFPKEWKFKTLMVSFVVFFVFAFLVTGERNSLFRLLLVVFLLYHVLYKRVPFRYFLLIFPLALAGNVIAQQLKMILLRPDVAFSLDNILIDMFYGEFKSSCRNLAIVMESIPSVHPFFFGKAFLYDVSRVFVPGFLMPHAYSTTIWFNQTFFPRFFASGGGVGFSMVGVGYINFGLSGVVTLFALLGLMIRKLYRSCSRSSISFIIYVNIIPIFLFSMRGDLATFFSQSIKSVLVVIVMIAVIDELAPKRRTSSLILRGRA